MNSIISVKNLGKHYRIGRSEARYATVREALTQTFRAPWDRLRRRQRRVRDGACGPEGHIWALKGVGFEVTPGEVVGIIGRNGAGKSTLLKVLSRITEPTEGTVGLWGRVAALLEVGTGFHPELTGRENIYLSGSILGMRKAELDRKFDEIVEFAEVEQFLDTPIKRYSSGMHVRLAFAVAAHLEPEILVIDEVLAVGDANFQKKCLGKLEQAGTQGRTVLFVSHSMPMVLRLCNRVILLDRGEVVADGTPEEVTRRYLHSEHGSPAQREWPLQREAPGDEVARLRAVRVLNEQGLVDESLDIRKPFFIEIEYFNQQSTIRPIAAIHLINEEGIILFASSDMCNFNWANSPRFPCMVCARCSIPGNFLAEGRVFVLAAVVSYNPTAVHALERDAVSFQIVDRTEGDGVRGQCALPWPGVMRPMLNWDINVNKLSIDNN
jgi:lipopolysaccharide transport system ATP-binding protein